MHPVERLRYVARSSGAPQALLVDESAGALSSFAGDANGLVTACRRMLARQPTSGPLLWLAASMLAAPEPRAAARDCAHRIENDATARGLAAALPPDATVCVLGWPDVTGDAIARRGDLDVLVVDVAGEGGGFVRRLLRADIDAADVPVDGLGAAVTGADVVLLEATAVGPTHAVAVAGSLAAAAVAATSSTQAILVAGIGRFLPRRMWDGLERRVTGEQVGPWELDDDLVPLELITDVAGPDGLESVDDARHHTDCPVVPELFGSHDGIAI